MMKGRVHGVTLVELLVTLAIAAILAAIAVPSMIEFVRDSQMRTTSGQLMSDLQFARSEAIRRNGPVLFCAVAGCAIPGGNWSGGWSVCVDENDDRVCDSYTTTVPGPLRSRAAVDSKLTLMGPTSGMSFRPDGSQGVVGGAASTLTLSGTWSAAPRYQHIISSTGVIALKKS